MQKIGSLKINQGAFLAPMADYTNVAFRELCKEYGASLVYTELISAKALTMKNKKTSQLILTSEKEKPVFLQLFGNNPDDFAKAVNFVEKKFPEKFAGYDLNAGCSVPKAKKGIYGSYLMNYPKLIGNIVQAMKFETKKPVTVKMRLGVNEETFLDCAKEAEGAGVDAVCLHARLGVDGYSGKVRWEKIKELKEKISIPVIGNGDINSAEDVLRIKKETNCDYVMIGRSAIGNAFIFTQIQQALAGKKVFERTQQEKNKESEKYLKLAEKYGLKLNDVRGYFFNWVKGEKGAPQKRNLISQVNNISELSAVVF